MSMELMVIAVLVALNALSLGQSYAMRQRIIVLETINGEMARRLVAASGLSNEDVAKLYETGLTMDKILQIIALVKMYGPVVVEIVLALHHNGEEVWPGGGGDCACAG